MSLTNEERAIAAAAAEKFPVGKARSWFGHSYATNTKDAALLLRNPELAADG